MTTLPIRIYLLDDHEVVRGGLRALLEAAGDVRRTQAAVLASQLLNSSSS